MIFYLKKIRETKKPEFKKTMIFCNIKVLITGTFQKQAFE